MDFDYVRISYHDIVVFVDDASYKLADDYSLELTCSKVGGWTLWRNKTILIGGEYNGNEFRIEAAGVVVCGVVKVTISETV